MTGDRFITVLLAVLASNVLSAFLAAWLVRYRTGAETRKLRAEATKIRAEADETSSGAWKELVQPLRDEVQYLRSELLDMRGDVSSLSRENAGLKATLKAAKEELGILRRLERQSTIRSTEETVALKVKLAEHGIEVPAPSSPPPLERTRASDREDDR